MDEENEKKKLEQISEEPSVELIDELPNDIPEQEIIESAPAVGSVPVIESTAPPTPPTPPKRSKKGPIITIICILLAIIAAVCIFLFWPKTTPLEDFSEKFTTAENIALVSSNSFTFKNPELVGAKSIDVIFSASSLELPTDLSAEIDIFSDYNEEFSLTVDAKITADGDVYLKFKNAEEFLSDINLSEILRLIFGEDFYDFGITEIDDEWWKVDGDDFAFISSLFTDQDSLETGHATCFGQALKNINLRDSGIVSISQKSRTATGISQEKSNLFPLVIDSDALEDTFSGVAGCFAGSEGAVSSSRLAAFIGDAPTFYLELGSEDFALTYPRVFASAENSEYIFNSSTDIIFGAKSDFRSPDSYLLLSDLLSLYYIQLGPDVIDEE
ncbi:hypothetical protein IJF86_01255 [Candidatus Saccharibacteria bacterium]|nr:hypothetical protein [Candidatus Saccharibacteria bacterium]